MIFKWILNVKGFFVPVEKKTPEIIQGVEKEMKRNTNEYMGHSCMTQYVNKLIKGWNFRSIPKMDVGTGKCFKNPKCEST